MEDNGKFGWFLAGAIFGAGVALLFAPKTGEETRNLIDETTKGSRETLEATTHDLMEKSKELYERGRQIADDAADLFERGRKLVQG